MTTTQSTIAENIYVNIGIIMHDQWLLMFM